MVAHAALILGMQLRYNRDHAFALHLRMIFALAFVPPNDAINAFDTLCQQIRNSCNADADDLLEYFEDTSLVALDKTHLAVFRCF